MFAGFLPVSFDDWLLWLLMDFVSWPAPLLLNCAVVPETRLSCLFANVFSNDALESMSADVLFRAGPIVLITTGFGCCVEADCVGVIELAFYDSVI